MSQQHVKPYSPLRTLLQRAGFFSAVLLLFLTIFAPRITQVRVHEYAAVIFAVCIFSHICTNFWQLTHLLTRKGPYFYWRALVTCGLLLSCALTVISGIFISQYIFAFLDLPWGRQMRTLHNAAAVYFLIFLGLHIGLYAGRLLAWLKESLGRTVMQLCCLCALTAGAYGLYTFCSAETADKLLMRSSFAFFDYDAPKLYFFIDTASALVGFAAVSALLARALLLYSARD